MAADVKPKVTVLMPVYNASPFLKEAIESILDQSYTDFEFLIINDGSTDNSKEIIKSFNDSRIRLINNSGNEGLINTLNKGIALSKGEYIARMDADDVSFPSRLEKQVVFLDSNEKVAVLATRLIQINEKGENAGYWMEDKFAVTENQIKNLLPVINCIGHPTVMMRKKVIEQFTYSVKQKHSEDWGLWLKVLAEDYRIAKLEDTLLKYRIHSNSATVAANRKGVAKKIINFKFAYLSERLLSRCFKNSDYKVLKYFIRDCIKFLIPSFVLIILNELKVNPFKLLRQFILASDFFRKRKTIDNIFFFPFYHTGGAESVHLSIVEAVAYRKPVVFITGFSSNSAFKNDFKRSATLLEINYLIKSRIAKKWLVKRFKKIFDANEEAIIFGCNSKFYYDLIASVNKNVKCIDLIHAFVHSYEDGPELWSLPDVSRLSNRVIINNKTKSDFKLLYSENNIAPSFLNRIVFISNFVEEVEYIKKKSEGNLKILYVGRGGEEKRIHLISNAARLLAEKKLPVEFHFVGDVRSFIPVTDLQFCIIHGEITDQEKLRKLYEDAHILVITSSREGFPMVIMEAMMNGVVPFATAVGGIPERLQNNTNGILIDNADPDSIIESLVTAIEYFCSHRNELNTMSENTHKFAIANFKKETFVQSYRSLLIN